jgi:hypothetical protein
MTTGEHGERPFSVGDGMILVAALAVAILGFRLTAEHLRWEPGASTAWDVWVPDVLNKIASALALALVVIRLRKPRPGRDRLWRQPGWLACFGVVTTLALETLELLAIDIVEQVMAARASAASYLDLPTIFGEVLPFQAPDDIARAVIVLWGVLALSGRWTAERSVVDRLGRVVGWYWVVHAVASPWLALIP